MGEVSKIPFVRRREAFLVLGVNLFYPLVGLGTIYLGLLIEDWSVIVVGLLQFFSSFLVVGWIWALVYGIQVLLKAIRGKRNSPNRGRTIGQRHDDKVRHARRQAANIREPPPVAKLPDVEIAARKAKRQKCSVAPASRGGGKGEKQRDRRRHADK